MGIGPTHTVSLDHARELAQRFACNSSGSIH
jgi:hypothetical protein